MGTREAPPKEGAGTPKVSEGRTDEPLPSGSLLALVSRTLSGPPETVPTSGIQPSNT